MTALMLAATALTASTALMVLVLVVRAPVRRSVGPRLGYALWALPAIRMMLPPLPTTMVPGLPVAGAATRGMSVLFVGPRGAMGTPEVPNLSALDQSLLAVWLLGAVAVFATYAVRHWLFCRRLRATSAAFGQVGDIPIIAADVDGPLAFGVFRRFIVVPRGFAQSFRADERDLALAHEHAHHRRGDLLANWASLVVLAVHWWNPVAWVAIRAFREDQECAADAHVLADRAPGAVALYARVLVKAAGIGALPACNLNPRANLKGRLMILAQKPMSNRRIGAGSAALVLAGSIALAATAATPVASGATTGKQAVTLGVKPDGSGGYALIVGGTAVAPGTALPGGMTLPADFSGAGGCSLKPDAKPRAMAIKGFGATRTYTVMCASAASAPIRATLAEGLSSLNKMRRSVAMQPASAAFPETERTHALGAIDRSIREIEASLATAG